VSDTAAKVYTFLDELGIPYRRAEHAPVHTIEDCAAVDRSLNSLTAKNYFLATKHRDHFYLCLVRPNARFKSVDVSRQIGSTRLSFAEEEHLLRLLRVHPGAVSPMGLIFDENREVQLLVDAGLKDVEQISFHPCDNTQTLAMSAEDFFGRFLSAAGHEPRFVEIHDFIE
jgi:Ala-tRNA(Pro) deacylase